MHGSTANRLGLDLSALLKQPGFSSRSALAAQQRLGEALVDHELDWPDGQVEVTLHRGQVASCELYALRYGGQVEIRPQPFEDFVLVQMPLQGNATLQCDGVSYCVSPGDTAVLAPRQNARVMWNAGCEQLILKLPRALFEASQRHLQLDSELPALSRLQRPLSVRWLRLVSELLEHLPSGEQAVPLSPWLRHLEQSLPLFLLSHCSADLATRCELRQPARHLERIEACMRGHLNRSISLPQLASEAGMSIRSLNSLCQREFAQSPMDRLRALRLDAARAHLMGNPHASVTEVALEYGFAHVGRFAAYYRQRFGELPRQTRG
ncbi:MULTISPECIES: AraC family transcriptional regulator [Pseudomonas]|uniref:AraC family transcriptional regulator n=1 Tax=Pseudomonas TaxID=286 RepID=UPI0018AA0AD3|nr:MULTISPECIES: AraC family transcriptional regulator [Pseudomonas]MBF8745334.1 AraC family transcriptional regulator [Pseudomonas monteilii]MCT8165171.1 AraC family transcriptional regulator [Pseudomonas sp. HD6422]MCT8184162.1 AraC family transcriptional regulator [Pseudomonas sp. HD6421]